MRRSLSLTAHHRSVAPDLGSTCPYATINSSRGGLYVTISDWKTSFRRPEAGSIGRAGIQLRFSIKPLISLCLGVIPARRTLSEFVMISAPVPRRYTCTIPAGIKTDPPCSSSTGFIIAIHSVLGSSGKDCAASCAWRRALSTAELGGWLRSPSLPSRLRASEMAAVMPALIVEADDTASRNAE